MAGFRYSDKNALHPISFVELDAMHTHIELLLTGLKREQGEKFAQEAERRIKDMEQRFNRHDMKSPLAVLNSRAAAERVEVDDELFMALELCEVFRVATRGYFSVATNTAGVEHTPYVLDGATHGVKFTTDGVQLDMGGFAKGFALDQVLKLSRESGAASALLNFGNSSVAAVGHHPYGEWWAVGVENTAQRGTLAYEAHLCDAAMSVSGRTPAGEYHIVDPHTGLKVAQDGMIVVEGRSALVAEVLSTALYAAPQSEREAIMQQFEGYRATEIICYKGGGVEKRIIK
ncbi:MAG: FAD:protein FMN transferase [Alistipes sp.]|nr:FAD:protein FMN transferase [Alistipes sp.]